MTYVYTIENTKTTGINGKSYHGTYYKSAGDYCRIKLNKKQGV